MKQLNRRYLPNTWQICVISLFSFVLLIFSFAATAQSTYPDRPITLVVPSTPGGGTDSSSRIIVPKLSELLGQPIVIVNRPGASGNIGAASVATAKNDGYTLLTMISSNVISSQMGNVNYSIETDFTHISRTVTVQGVLVSTAALPTKNLTELISYIKTNPSKVNFGSAGNGSFSHLMMEFFQTNAGVKIMHVPYKSTAQAMTDLLANHVSMMIVDITLALPHIKSGNLRAYGVTSNVRSPIDLSIPTLSEAGLKGFEGVQWFGLVAPANLPPMVTQRLFKALTMTLEDPKVKEQFAKDGMLPQPNASPEEFSGFIRAEGSKWGRIIQEMNVKN